MISDHVFSVELELRILESVGGPEKEANVRVE